MRTRRTFPAAASAFEEVLKLNPQAVPAQLSSARLRLATGKPGQAVELAERAVGSQPQSARPAPAHAGPTAAVRTG